METHFKATERNPPYGITKCYLPPDTGERWVDLGGWLHTEMVHLPAGSHPSQY